MPLPARSWRQAAQWRALLRHVGECEASQDYTGAIASLRELIADVERYELDAWAAGLRAKALGQLGNACAAQGDSRGAREYTLAALRACEEINDEVGVNTYRANLALLAADAVESGDDPQLKSARNALLEAQELSDNGEFAASNAVLTELLNRSQQSRELVARARGLVGSNYYRLGELANAARETEMARRMCAEMGDADGVFVY